MEFIAAFLADPERPRLARAMRRELSLCNHCLGRQFARLPGPELEARGTSIRARLRLPPGDRCDICSGIFRSLDSWAERAARAVEGLEFENFQVGTRPGGLLVEAEEALWARFGARWAEPFRMEMNRLAGESLKARLGKRLAADRPDVAILLDLSRDRVEVTVNSLFLFGRYRKLVRDIPQTRWPCRECRGRGCPRCGGTGKMYAESVEEIIREPAVEAYSAKDGVLHGAGREDIDARMLGRGRPFVLELLEPRRRTADLDALARRINEATGSKVEVEGLRPSLPDEVVRLKEERFDKTYRVRFRVAPAPDGEALERTLASLVATIRQQTPARVAHRRADRFRERKVHSVRLLSRAPADRGLDAEAEIETEAGLYVKELLTGDGGRTEPSLAGLLGAAVEVLELDVLDVKMGAE
ncbi:MAG: tRNA pseudouridine(54/55) synthase Pus10 [Halobacteria archaeon]